jgi:hypothetical protein
MSRSVLGAVLFGALGCASTNLTDKWRDPAFDAPPLRSIVVFGLSRDFTARRVFEDRFVEKLSRRGVRAQASYRMLPGEEKPDEATVRQAVRDAGAEGALITYLVSVSHRVTASPGYAGLGYGFGGPFYPDYYGTWGLVYAPGYLSTDTIVRLTTRLYVADGEGRHVWTGDSSTLNPGSVKDLAGDVIGQVVDELSEQRLIP